MGVTAHGESGQGSAGDALQPFVDALTLAGKAAARESAGNPQVIAAVKLGWLMKELTQGWPPEPLPEGLPSGGPEKFQAQGLALTTLLDTLKLSARDPDAAAAVTGALELGPAGELAAKLEPALIVGLAGVDARLPKASALGGGLRGLIPDTDSAGQGQVGAAGVPAPTKSLVDALDALSSDLPSHAARGVANSLAQWSLSADARKPDLARAQVNLWRIVIVGEKKGTELLEPADYLEAARRLENHYARRALTSGWLWGFIVAAILLFAIGVALLFGAHGHAGNVAAGASGVLAALGLTWKGIGGTLGKLVGRLEAPLWGAELDTAITDVITLAEPRQSKPASTPEALRYADRGARALSARPGQRRN